MLFFFVINLFSERSNHAEKKSENYLSASSSEDAGEWIKILTEMSKERKGSRVRVERVESGVGEDGGGEEGRVQKKKKLSLEDLRTIKRYYDEENPNPSQQQVLFITYLSFFFSFSHFLSLDQSSLFATFKSKNDRKSWKMV